MPRWLRVVRGVIGTGVTFAAGVGVLASAIGVAVWLADRISARELMQIVGKSSVVAFILGVAFAGVLAITARARRINRLSLGLVSGLGTGAGLLYWIVLAFNGGRNWSTRNAITNFLLLTAMGAGSAAATMMIARRARSALDSGGGLSGLGAGDEEIVPSRRSSKVTIPKL